MYLFPEMKDKAMEIARESMAKRPGATDEQIEMGMNVMKKFFNVFLIAGALFGTLIVGVIFSLIGGAVAEKKGPRPFQPVG